MVGRHAVWHWKSHEEHKETGHTLWGQPLIERHGVSSWGYAPGRRGSYKKDKLRVGGRLRAYTAISVAPSQTRDNALYAMR